MFKRGIFYGCVILSTFCSPANNWAIYFLSTDHGSPRICITLLVFASMMRDVTDAYSFASTLVTIQFKQITQYYHSPGFFERIEMNAETGKLTVNGSWVHFLVVKCYGFSPLGFIGQLDIGFHRTVFDDIDAFFSVQNLDAPEKGDYIVFRHLPLKATCQHYVRRKFNNNLLRTWTTAKEMKKGDVYKKNSSNILHKANNNECQYQSSHIFRSI